MEKVDDTGEIKTSQRQESANQQHIYKYNINENLREYKIEYDKTKKKHKKNPTTTTNRRSDKNTIFLLLWFKMS